MTADVITRLDPTTARWKAIVEYKTDNGVIDIEHAIEELEELQDIIERGPDWNALVRITITLDRRNYDMTVEQATLL